MSDDPLPPAPADDEAAARSPADAARQRFYIIGFFRLSGVFILLFGIMVSLHRFGWAQGDMAKYLGFILSAVGLFQTLFLPRMLARAWATPRERP